jgi:hypothetical protein
MTGGSKATAATINDPLFHVKFKRLLRIVIPSLRSREAAMLALHSFFLVADWTESLCGRVGWAVGGDSLTSYR